jgi:hypothetical protein
MTGYACPAASRPVLEFRSILAGILLTNRDDARNGRVVMRSAPRENPGAQTVSVHFFASGTCSNRLAASRGQPVFLVFTRDPALNVAASRGQPVFLVFTRDPALNLFA